LIKILNRLWKMSENCRPAGGIFWLTL